MINDQTFLKEEAEVRKLFAEAGWSEIPTPNEIRIQKIEERAISEMIIKESISFVFYGFESVLSSFASSFLSRKDYGPQDYKV